MLCNGNPLVSMSGSFLETLFLPILRLETRWQEIGGYRLWLSMEVLDAMWTAISRTKTLFLIPLSVEIGLDLSGALQQVAHPRGHVKLTWVAIQRHSPPHIGPSIPSRYISCKRMRLWMAMVELWFVLSGLMPEIGVFCLPRRWMGLDWANLKLMSLFWWPINVHS